ncbi:MAG TPA: MFS transporter [Candidatus Limnocylindrales bacterium]|nr:MFS transporter [Candidatus Limnocylindrales bacterium]
MTAAVTPDRARAARLAVSAVFFVNGAVSASILTRTPAIKDGLGLTDGELGIVLAALPVGGLLAGGFAGLLIARVGSGRLAVATSLALAAMLAVVGIASTWLTLTLAMLVLGMFDATMDTAMNAHGIGVQRTYGRSILQGFHGVWSVGSLAAGAVGAVIAGAGVSVAVHFLGLAVVLAAAVLVSARLFLPASVADGPHADGGDHAFTLARLPRMLRVLVPIALLGILCVTLQGSAASWGAVYLSDVLDQPEGIAALAFVLYMAAMVAGRLTNDRWVDRFGSETVVRAGALIGVLGIVVVIAAAPLGQPVLAFAGFAAVGLGSSSMFPVMIGAAGSRPGIPAGHGVALVAWLVRVGLILQPAVVGAAADQWGLTAAFGIPLVAGIVIALIAPVLSGGRVRLRHAAPVS